MSRATRAGIESAVQAHVRDRCRDGEDLALTDWLVLSTSIRMSVDDELTTYVQAKSKMPPHVAVGLLVRALSLALRDAAD